MLQGPPHDSDGSSDRTASPPQVLLEAQQNAAADLDFLGAPVWSCTGSLTGTSRSGSRDLSAQTSPCGSPKEGASLPRGYKEKRPLQLSEDTGSSLAVASAAMGVAEGRAPGDGGPPGEGPLAVVEKSSSVGGGLRLSHNLKGLRRTLSSAVQILRRRSITSSPSHGASSATQSPTALQLQLQEAGGEADAVPGCASTAEGGPSKELIDRDPMTWLERLSSA